jgi:hypothetical protein
MKNRFFTHVLIFATVILGMQCTKAVDLKSEPLGSYVNLQPGKYIIYRLDSTVKIPFNDTGFVVHSYLAKDVIDAQITDNLGRPSFRVIRYMRDTASLSENDWEPTLTYMVTPGTQTIEVIENNLRYQKLSLPIKEFFSWNGNKFLDNSEPLAAFFTFNNDDTMGGWEFYYEAVDKQEVIMDKLYDSVITVKQVDDSQNFPANDITDFGRKDYSVEKYAKHIGLVYKELTMIEFQAANNVFPYGYKEGFTLKMQILEHN